MSAIEMTAGASPRADISERSQLLRIDPDSFLEDFNRKPFIFGHNLSSSALFSLPRLIELSKRLPAGCVRYNSGNIPVATGLYEGPQTGLSVEQTIKQIEDCHSWMVLKYVEQDPEYRQLLDNCLDEIQSVIDPVDPGMSGRHGFIFITSPRSITPFHLDPEYGTLLQIRGSKSVKTLDISNRNMLTEQAIEGFFSLPRIDPIFKEEYGEKAARFILRPGEGLHLPYIVPHWVENGPEVSISFSLTFRTDWTERKSIVHHVNGRLRRRGFTPTPFGDSPVKDYAKFFAFRLERRLKRRGEREKG
ncbi:MAG TPA: transcription factor [Blastocatellia bacterium]|jgi:hypothetical protein